MVVILCGVVCTSGVSNILVPASRMPRVLIVLVVYTVWYNAVVYAGSEY